jgi:hypothetical protein
VLRSLRFGPSEALSDDDDDDKQLNVEITTALTEGNGTIITQELWIGGELVFSATLTTIEYSKPLSPSSEYHPPSHSQASRLVDTFHSVY